MSEVYHHVADVLADPAFRHAAIPNQLAEVMRRARGSLNPRNVQEQLIAALRQRAERAEAALQKGGPDAGR